MKTQQFIKEHRFVKTKNGRFMMQSIIQSNYYVIFDGEANIVFILGVNPTPQETLTIHNLIITYLDDLYMSEFDEIKSMM